MSYRLLLAGAVCAAAVASAMPVASAAERSTTITGWTKAPGPRADDKLAVTKFGSAAPARNDYLKTVVPRLEGLVRKK
jgi:ABC-type glycerol-3-phosphate transport system substrate-binding protein